MASLSLETLKKFVYIGMFWVSGVPIYADQMPIGGLEDLSISIIDDASSQPSERNYQVEGKVFPSDDVEIIPLSAEILTRNAFAVGGKLYKRTQTPLGSYKLYSQIIKEGDVKKAIANLIAGDDQMADAGLVSHYSDPIFLEQVRKLYNGKIFIQPVLLIQKAPDLVNLYVWNKGPDYKILTIVMERNIGGCWKIIPAAYSDSLTPDIMDIRAALIKQDKQENTGKRFISIKRSARKSN